VSGDAAAAGFIRWVGQRFNLFYQVPSQAQTRIVQNHALSDEEIQALVQQRTQAKKDRDFALADSIRAQLSENSVEIEDSREGTRWTRV